MVSPQMVMSLDLSYGMAIFFLFLVPFFVLFFFAYKYRNPYKCVFIFGKKGSGKSCLMVNLMIKYRKRGWNIYTDIQDIRIPGVRIIDSSMLQNFRPEPHSAIFLDEVGISMDNRSFKNFPPGLRDFFKYVRKMRCCVYLNSQAFDVDKKVRDTTDSMILQSSIANCISVSRPIRRRVTLTEPSAEAESRIADRLTFAPLWDWRFYWMPSYFKYFDSFEMPDRPLLPYREPKHPIHLGFDFYKLIGEVRMLVKTPYECLKDQADDFEE